MLATFPVIPLPDGVVYPGSVVTITLESAEARAAVQAAKVAGTGNQILLVPRVDTDGATAYAKVGTLATVDQVGELPNGSTAAIIRATGRALIGAGIAAPDGGEGLWVTAEVVSDQSSGARAEDVAARVTELRSVLKSLGEFRRSRRLPELLRSVSDPVALIDAVAAWSDAPLDVKVDVLEAVDLMNRIDVLSTWARTQLTELEANDTIRRDVEESLEKTQREFVLRRQLDAIRKELGETNGEGGVDYRTKLSAVADVLPAQARESIEREIDRLERTSEQSPEQSWIRTWLDRVLELPWATRTDDNDDLRHARSVLDADHTGLDDVKERIMEMLAVRRLRRDRAAEAAAADVDSPTDTAAASTQRAEQAGAIVLLSGPPGVGKTSLGESVAKAMGRQFVRIALGGVRDEAEIRGHRRTYVGAQPGRIVRAIKEAGSMNPVVLLDEVDKMSAGGWSGDPTAALLEVLDPAQNHTFRDHYLEIELDLSDVVFLATANQLETIPGPLLDRMEIVRLDGYTDAEKVVIGRDHLLPRQRQRAGLRADELIVTDDALRTVVTEYTREAGVRSLERELGKLARKVATKIAVDNAGSVAVDSPDVPGLLGKRRFFDEVAERTLVPGVATGLAVTGVGGDVLFVEVSASPSTNGPELVLTGQLGDVMKESAQIAISYVRANAETLGVDRERLNQRFHVHFPAGAIPKDGPSAGVTMTSALVSVLTGRTVRSDVGMTGEVTLQGKVLPIGGVKQKVLAAHRAGLTTVILPERNGPDLDDVPSVVREQMTFVLASRLDDVLSTALASA
jgi:ATP-dependent Lon protease